MKGVRDGIVMHTPLTVTTCREVHERFAIEVENVSMTGLCVVEGCHNMAANHWGQAWARQKVPGGDLLP